MFLGCTRAGSVRLHTHPWFSFSEVCATIMPSFKVLFLMYTNIFLSPPMSFLPSKCVWKYQNKLKASRHFLWDMVLVQIVRGSLGSEIQSLNSHLYPIVHFGVPFLLQLVGLGPHNPKKKQDLDKLYDLKTKAQQIMNQFGPSTLINLSSFSSIKPEPANTPPQSSMANSTTVAKMPGTPSGGGRLSPESNQVISLEILGKPGVVQSLP